MTESNPTLRSRLASVFEWLPKPALAGLLFLVAWGLIDFHHIARIDRASRSELAVLAITFLATLLLVDGVHFAGVAGAEALAQEAEHRSRNGGGLHLVGLKPGVCDPLTRGDYFREIAAENTYEGTSDAIAHVVPNLNPEICRACTARIFRECSAQPSPIHR